MRLCYVLVFWKCLFFESKILSIMFKWFLSIFFFNFKQLCRLLYFLVQNFVLFQIHFSYVDNFVIDSFLLIFLLISWTKFYVLLKFTILWTDVWSKVTTSQCLPNNILNTSLYSTVFNAWFLIYFYSKKLEF